MSRLATHLFICHSLSPYFHFSFSIFSSSTGQRKNLKELRGGGGKLWKLLGHGVLLIHALKKAARALRTCAIVDDAQHVARPPACGKCRRNSFSGEIKQKGNEWQAKGKQRRVGGPLYSSVASSEHRLAASATDLLAGP